MKRAQLILGGAVIVVVTWLLPNGLLGGALGLLAGSFDQGDCWKLATSNEQPEGAHLAGRQANGSALIEFPAHGGGTCIVVVDPDASELLRSQVTFRS